MKPEDFVNAIRERVVENNLSIYKSQLETHDAISDSTWRNIIKIYNKMSDEEKKNFLDFVRLIEVNTISHIFGILDGSTYLDGSKELFSLTTNTSSKKINGELQDIFLEQEE